MINPIYQITRILICSALLAPATAYTHSQDDVLMDEHRELDDVVVTTQQEQALKKRLATNKATSTNTRTLAAVVAGQEYLQGKWEGPYDWPIIGIHLTLLNNGKVMAFDSSGDGPTAAFNDQTYSRGDLWDPTTNTHTPATISLGYNIFCSGHANLANGQVFLAGGNKNQLLDGLNKLSNYNPYLNTDFAHQFSAVGTMVYERWYPSVTALANGEMLVSGGGVKTPEVRKADGSMRTLSNINESFAASRLYHWLKQAPNGKVAYVGPSPQLRYLETKDNGKWEVVGNRDTLNRNYGSHASYGVDKILVSGGNIPAVASAISVNLNTLSPTPVASMKYARRQHNLTVLPDGSVLATGGFSGSKTLFDYTTAVYPAEWWNPSANTWTELAPMSVHRGYHSTALLLPDARVLSAGGGICDSCFDAGYHNKNAEIFSPPYLFKKDGSGQLAIRPVISAVPDNITPNKSFTISTANANSIQKVTLIRLGSVTHSTNMEQNYIPLMFSKNINSLKATAPANNFIAPPGYYMLFILNTSGVPSVAKIIKVNGGDTVTVPAAN